MRYLSAILAAGVLLAFAPFAAAEGDGAPGAADPTADGPAIEAPAEESAEAVEEPEGTETLEKPIDKRLEELFQSYERLARVMEIVESRYVKPVDSEELFEGALNGILDSLDPYSSYIPPHLYDDFVRETEQKISGIGVTIRPEEGRMKIIATLEGMPAFRAGVKPGDYITEIEGDSVERMGSSSEVARRLRGENGTAVTLTIYRPLTDREFTVTLTREDIPVTSLRGYRHDPSTGTWDYMLDPAEGIGYIRMSQFMQNTPTELDDAYNALVGRGLKGLVLDLRFNPGGLLDSATAIVDRFIDHGLIVRTKGRGGVHNESYARPYDTYDPQLPLVIVVNEFSASASEVTGGALQDYHRARLVGARTFGKGSVQNVIPLDGHGAIRLTIAYYYTPSGRLVHRLPGAMEWGLDPDEEVELSSEEDMAVRDEWARVAAGGAPESLGEGGGEVIDLQLARAVEVLRGEMGLTAAPVAAPAEDADATSEPDESGE
jgi:carboxyl-terminal processing protease